MATMVLARIKRMGKQWASCGVPVSPPKELRNDPTIKRRCPKLVPGQVIEVPNTHNLLNQDCVEIVRKVERDEFRRPWVFRTAEEAAMADPSRSRMGPDQIAAGLALAEGAQRKGLRALEEREANRARAEMDEDQRAGIGSDGVRLGRALPDDDDRESEELEDDGDGLEEDVNARRSRNRVTKDEADELRGKDEEEPEEDRAPARGRGRGRGRAAAR